MHLASLLVLLTVTAVAMSACAAAEKTAYQEHLATIVPARPIEAIAPAAPPMIETAAAVEVE